MKKLLLIDGMAAVYRAFYALNRTPRVNSKGMNTSCVLGFSTTLLDLLRTRQPTHVGVAFDLPKPTFRHEMYTDYKANRDAMPEEIQQGLPWIRRMIDAFRIPILTCEGFEADDVIGTLSHAAEQAGFDNVLMVTPDKDFAQLVTPCVQMYRFAHGRQPDSIIDVAEVQRRFGVERCTQVIDLLGLWGDAADNIPGIRGVGEKTAKKLIAQFGSIEEMIVHADEIKNDKVRQLVIDHADDALFSKKLATIRLDAPIAFDPQQLLLRQPDYEQLRTLCDELEFRQFARKVFSKLPPTTTELRAPSTAPQATSIPSTQPTLFDPPSPAPDSEPPTPRSELQTADSELTPSALASLAGHDIAILIEGPQLAVATGADSVFTTTLDRLQPHFDQLASLLADPTTTKLVYDLKTLKYLLHELLASPNSELLAPDSGLLAGTVFDVQLAHYLLDPEMRHTLDYIVSGTLGTEPHSLAARAAALWQLYPILAARMNDANLFPLYNDIELPLVDVLIDMERTGVRIDVDALRQYAASLHDERRQLEQQIYQLAGEPFNIASPRQLGHVLYEQLQITDRPPLTATKQFSTAEEVLQRLANAHPIVPLILQHRSISKLLGTYLDSFPKLISPVDHRLHTLFNQTVTATGRLSSSNPNLQNIPIRTERGREIRRAFVPADNDHLILAADYSQIELRIIASLSHDPHLLEAFASGLDIHAATAARIYHLALDQVGKEQRRNAKSVNFGIVYGISAFGLSQQLDIPRKEAAALIDEYFAQYPAVLEFIEQSKQFARSHGYAATLLGRRRYLPDINSRNAAARSFAERNAVNMPIQGTSADMIKLAMVHIHSEMQRRHMQSRLILQVHDELVFDVPRTEADTMRTLVGEGMKHALPLDGVDIQVGIDLGDNWLEAH